MSRCRPFWLCAGIFVWLVGLRPLHAQMGWTEAKVEQQFGHAIKDRDGELKHVLPPDKYPELNAGGFNRVRFDYFNGKVTRLELSWMPVLPTKIAKNRSKEELEQVVGDYDAAHKGKMSYETAKRSALLFIEPNPEPAAVEHEEHVVPQSTPPQDSGAFIYKGWHFHWLVNEYPGGQRLQQFTIESARDTTRDKVSGARGSP